MGLVVELGVGLRLELGLGLDWEVGLYNQLQCVVLPHRTMHYLDLLVAITVQSDHILFVGNDCASRSIPPKFVDDREPQY